MPPHASPSFIDSGRKGMGVLIILSQGWSDSFLVFLRTRFGSRFRGISGAVAIVLMIFWTVCFADRGHDPRPMFLFMALFTVASACHQLAAGWRLLRRIPEQNHSSYSGISRLMKRFPRLSELTIKLKVEPAYVMFLGIVILLLNVPLGLYFLGGAVCMNLDVAFVETCQRKQALRMHDMMLEQQSMSDRLQEIRRRQF